MRPNYSSEIEAESIPMAIKAFQNFRQFFYLHDITDNFEYGESKLKTIELLKNDPHFIIINETSSDDFQILAEKSLFLWYSEVIIKILKISENKITITRNQLKSLFSMYFNQNFYELPQEVIEYGEKYSFITSIFNGDFLLPFIVSFHFLVNNREKGRTFLHAIKEIFKTIGRVDIEERDQILNQDQENYFIETIRHLFSYKELIDRLVDIIICREGLLNRSINTLVEISKRYGVTRERIRQLDHSFWIRYSHSYEGRINMLNILIRNTYISHGSLLIDENNKLIFCLAKHFNIPIHNILDTNIYIFHNEEFNFEILHQIYIDKSSFLDENELIKFLEQSFLLNKKDMELISKQNIEFRKSSSKMSEKVIATLRTIKKPAHYSKVHDKFNSLFPEIYITENSIHVILDRLTKKDKVVWIGIKGTYALKEWGYERPVLGLYETITKIVKTHYEKFGTPISKNKIRVEISKFRKVINKNSLIMAISLNKEILCVSKDCYIPANSSNKSIGVETSVDESIHKGLESFQEILEKHK